MFSKKSLGIIRQDIFLIEGSFSDLDFVRMDLCKKQ